MRVFLCAGLSALALLGVACSDAPTSNALANMRRASAANDPEPAPASKPAKNATPSKPSSDAPTPPEPRATPDAGAPSSGPAPAPVPGSCEAPKCVGAAGLCGCKATDASGALVVMGCQDGACACTGATDANNTDFEGDCASADDAKGLFFANCGCQ